MTWIWEGLTIACHGHGDIQSQVHVTRWDDTKESKTPCQCTMCAARKAKPSRFEVMILCCGTKMSKIADLYRSLSTEYSCRIWS